MGGGSVIDVARGGGCCKAAGNQWAVVDGCAPGQPWAAEVPNSGRPGF